MTTLMRWNPLLSSRRDPFRSDFDQLFDSLVSGSTPGNGIHYVPPTDVHETAEAYVIRMDLPGVVQKDVKVSILGDTLTVRGERKLDEVREKENIHYRERRSGSFERAFTLAAPVRPDQVRASYKDGVLEVTVPKAEEARTREIEIQVS
jgi:HSP20 family protein